MPSNSGLITNVDTVQAFALHQRTTCIKSLKKISISGCNLVICIIRVRKEKKGLKPK